MTTPLHSPIRPRGDGSPRPGQDYGRCDSRSNAPGHCWGRSGVDDRQAAAALLDEGLGQCRALGLRSLGAQDRRAPWRGDPGGGVAVRRSQWTAARTAGLGSGTGNTGRSASVRVSSGWPICAVVVSRDAPVDAGTRSPCARARPGSAVSPKGPLRRPVMRRAMGFGRTRDAAPSLDARAVEAYRARIEDLQDQIEEAETFADPERAARARDERDFIVAELGRVLGLGGRTRRSVSTENEPDRASRRRSSGPSPDP